MNIVSSTKTLMSAALLGTVFALPATAETFDFTTYADGAQETLVQSVPGLSVSVTAGSYTFDNQGLLGSFNPDVDGLLDLAVSTQDGNGLFSGDAGIGVVLASLPGLGTNIGGLVDMLTFNFSRDVRFDSVMFGNVNSSDDVDIFVDGLLVAADSSIAGASPYSLSGLSGTSISFGADAFNDSFNVQAITATVPLPAGAILLLTGLGGLIGMRRRKAA